MWKPREGSADGGIRKKKKCNNCSQNWFRKLTKTPDYWTLLQIYWNYWNLQFIQVHTDSETPYYIYAAALPMAEFCERIQWNVTSALLHLRTVYKQQNCFSQFGGNKRQKIATSSYQLFFPPNEAVSPKFAAIFLVKYQVRLLGEGKVGAIR